MKVSDIMSRDVQVASPHQSIAEIAKIMADREIGFMPVGEDDRLIGTVTVTSSPVHSPMASAPTRRCAR